MSIPILNETEVFEKMLSQTNPFFKEYYAFYSSLWGGIVTNPNLIQIPLDDHMVHRGDGVFEAMKAVNRRVYLMDEHLARLQHSAQQISLRLNLTLEDMKEIVLSTLTVAAKDDASIRIFLSRGPGNFSVNPYDSVAPQFYVVVMQLKSPPQIQYTEGVHIGKTTLAAKPNWMAQVKSCNYLLNALMKKEAVDRQLDFVIGLNAEGYITESATENIFLIRGNKIIHPPLEYILKGTTMIRLCELAQKHGIITEVRPISIEDLLTADEVVLAGTTLNVLPVTNFEGSPIGDGKPGTVAKKLNEWLLADMMAGLKGTSF